MKLKATRGTVANQTKAWSWVLGRGTGRTVDGHTEILARIEVSGVSDVRSELALRVMCGVDGAVDIAYCARLGRDYVTYLRCPLAPLRLTPTRSAATIATF